MINEKESKQVRMGFCLLKIMLRDMKSETKNKYQSTNNPKK